MLVRLPLIQVVVEVPFELSNRIKLKSGLGVGLLFGLFIHLRDLFGADVEDVFDSAVEVGRESQELYA
jgi:hypothetical protein